MRQLQVVKIGTNSVFPDRTVDYALLFNLGYDLARLKYEKETDTILVVSGAIKLGVQEKGLQAKPSNAMSLQACARVGQPKLINTYTLGLNQGHEVYAKEKSMRNLRFLTALYLLTDVFLYNPRERRNTVISMYHDIAESALPLVNTNDGQNSTGKEWNNDTTGALVAKAVSADRLVILTDVDGLLDGGGNLVRRVKEINDEVVALCKEKGDGTGSMKTKLEAAKLLLSEDIPTMIGNAKRSLVELIENEDAKTLISR